MKPAVQFFFSLCYSILFVAINTPVIAQKNKTWPSCLDYTLKGNVKSWTMKIGDQIVRRQEFDKKGLLIKDTYKESEQTDVPPEYLPVKLKTEFEKIYQDKSALNDPKARIEFNEHRQLVEMKTQNAHIINKFTEQGKILANKTTQITKQTRAWNSMGHAEPTYSFTDTFQFVVIYKYNNAGMLKEFEYYHSDPFKNIRMVYFYDSSNNLVESNRYDEYNISSNFMEDHYIDKLSNHKIDPAFDINKVYEGYWGQGTPSKLTWKYDNKGNKIEYIAFGYMKGPSFKATWEYDDKGQLTKEIHHDVYHNTVSSIIEFDKKGNVTKETDFDYWAKKEYKFYYEIVYY
jgi:hypothetical protein